jgi:hypothetical protein
MQGEATVIDCRDLARPHGDGGFMIRQSCVMPGEVMQGDAVICECLGIVRLRGKSALEALQRLIGAP